MAKKYFKKCFLPFATKEIQIKTTLRFHVILLRMSNINRTTGNKGCGERGALIHC